jgi:hypothetical protein
MNHGENPVETFMKTTVFLIPIIYACVSFAHGATHEIKFCSFFSRRDMLNLCNRCQFFKIFRQNNRYLILGCFGSSVYREFFTRCCYGTFLWFEIHMFLWLRLLARGTRTVFPWLNWSISAFRHRHTILMSQMNMMKGRWLKIWGAIFVAIGMIECAADEYNRKCLNCPIRFTLPLVVSFTVSTEIRERCFSKNPNIEHYY